MSWRLLAALMLLLTLPETAFSQPSLDIVEAQCLHDGTVVGATSDLRLVILRDRTGHWQPLPVATGVGPLWRSPDDRIFAVADGSPWSVVEVPPDSRPSTHWTIPTDSGAMRFASVNGIDVVTHDRVYRLDPGGMLADLGETPVGGSGQPLRNRAPEILTSHGITVVCTGTSQREDDYVGGSCREARGTYLYRVDFGEPLCCESDVPYFAAPFVCGERSCRRFATGRRLIRTREPRLARSPPALSSAGRQARPGGGLPASMASGPCWSASEKSGS